MSKLRVLDLFSGIGGFSLGLERTGGFETVAFCEIEDYPRRVLARHWPGVPIYDDVRTLTANTLRRDGIAVDVICGGFPCQDISFAGKRAGLEGARSGLWGEYRRLIGELRPRFVIVENVPGLLSLGMGTVLGDLAALGYDATWDCIPASAVGAPHRRDRVWIVAHSRSERHKPDGESRELAGASRQIEGKGHKRERRRRAADGSREDVADVDIIARNERRSGNAAEVARGRDAYRGGKHEDLAHTIASRAQGGEEWLARADDALAPSWWSVEPDVGRVAHGVPSRVDRLKGLGNAVVPQVVEVIGRAILAAQREAA